MKLYAKRHGWDLEPHYSRHVSAMTAEGLHSKADIAAELAFRDARIAALEADNRRLRAACAANGLRVHKDWIEKVKP